jgi:mycothiol synthase
MVLKQGFTIRPAQMSDLVAVVALMNICSMKVIGRTDDSLEDIGADWQMPGFNQAQSQRVVIAPDGQVVGFAEVRDYPRPSYPFLDIYVHPDYETEGITDVLVEWGEERARAAIAIVPPDARVAMQAASYEQDRWYKQVLEDAGMQAIRHHWRMDIVLNTPPPLPKWPDGINVRTLIPGQDERNVLEVQRTAFRDHWGYMDQPFEAHFERWWFTWQNEGEFDPSLWFLAMDGEIIAGISLCKLNPAGDQDTGWVSTLGVRREYRRKGLGMALLLHSFQVFYQLGKARVGLGVDASSLTGATRLYQKAGMSVVMQIDIYEKELRPGRDLATRD